MRDTLSIIADMVGIAGSLKEAIRLVDEEVGKGDCFPIPKPPRDERIRSLWTKKRIAELNQQQIKEASQ